MQHYSVQTERERLYQAAAAGGPMYTIKVPIQSGIFCTGERASAKLLPPIGDFATPKRFDRAGGLMLVTDLCYELKRADRMVNGTVTFQAIKGGIDD